MILQMKSENVCLHARVYAKVLGQGIGVGPGVSDVNIRREEYVFRCKISNLEETWVVRTHE